ncbi:uncharacterized protein EAE98_011777 [Botrytis deweyae]|uniref:C2H2-type domain-containing protein n=1 Tax=Botrytis deweyae TaxID=2478750 RepID=A0ABQ7I509_9HELO|nr:uncharacterized protein EAE98_011777 [Botrytis deweyae]KAF7912020.1 hypothetical protein EAE98_011777 [Botrytis deweyae]
MDDHGDQFTSPSQDEEYIENHALYQQPDYPVAYVSRLPPRVQHQGPVDIQGYGTFEPASITETTIQPAFQVQPYTYPYTDGVVQHGNQTQQYNSESSHLNRLTMPAGIILQEGWPLENRYQQQATYTPTYTPTYAPVGDIPLEQVAVSHGPTHQTNTQINASYDAEVSSNVWSPGFCQHASCLAKPSDKQKNYREYSDWRRHWFRVHEKQHKCLIDGAIFGTAKDLERHIEAKHQTGAKRHYCHIAGCQARAREFNRKDKFQEHNDKWHGAYCCPVPYCDRGHSNGFKERELLRDHMRTRHDA